MGSAPSIRDEKVVCCGAIPAMAAHRRAAGSASVRRLQLAATAAGIVHGSGTVDGIHE